MGRAALQLLARVAAVLLLVLCAAAIAGAQPPPPPPPPPAPATVFVRPNAMPGGPTPAEASGDGLILGRVVDATTRGPVSGALVSLGGFPPPATLPTGVNMMFGLGQSGQPMVLTDGDGRFVFRDLAAGRFSLIVQAPGYLPGAQGSRRPEGSPGTITLGQAESRTDIEIPVWKAASIAGAVLDELGEPVIEVPVRLLRRSMVRGRPGFTAMGGSQTDDRGMYRVGNLAPGDYVVFAPSTLTTMPASAADAYLASVDSGDPAARQMTGSVNPSAAGGLPVGNQRVAADYGRALTPAPAEGERFAIYPTAFHPAASDPQGAAVVTLGSGDERTGVDIRTSLVPSYTVSGMAVGPAGPVPNAVVRLVPAYTSQLSSDGGLWSVTTSTDGQGRFTIVGATPGDYVIRVLQSPGALGASVVRAGDGTFMMTMGGMGGAASADPSVLAGEITVALLDRDLDGLIVNATGGARVSGRLEFIGRAKPPTPADLFRAGIQLIRADGQTMAPVTPTRADPTGAFTTSQFPTGPYTLSAGVPAAGWYLQSVRIGGREMIDRQFDLTSDLTDVVMTFTDAMGDLIGTARPSGGPSTEVNGSVVLFPADYREWINSGMGTRRARRVDLGASGAFELHSLLPGQYLAAAVTADSVFDLQDPADIEALARVATPVSITGTQRASLSLTVTRLR
jgi:hypothetical protein